MSVCKERVQTRTIMCIYIYNAHRVHNDEDDGASLVFIKRNQQQGLSPDRQVSLYIITTEVQELARRLTYRELLMNTHRVVT